MLTSTDLCPPNGFFPLTLLGEEYVHKPLEIPSSTSYKAKTREPKSVNSTPTTCLAILGCKLLRTICIRSLSEGLSMISTIFPRQGEMNDETDSSVLCLKALRSLLDTSTTVLNENCSKKSQAKSSHVRCLEDSKKQTIAGPPHSEIVGIK